MPSLRVLLAGDSGGTGVDAVRALFARTSVDVITAADGLDCVRKLRELRSDLLILEPGLLWGGCDGVLAMILEGSELPLIPVFMLLSPRQRPQLRTPDLTTQVIAEGNRTAADVMIVLDFLVNLALATQKLDCRGS